MSYRSWVQNSAITAFTVPEASGGDTPLSYSISGLPTGLSMSSSREVSGTPTASGVGTATVTVTDVDGDTDTLRFTWNVGADLTPTFGTATIADKTFKQNTAITAFYVPLASSGNPPRTYTATGLPAGVSIENTRRVSGTPTGHGMGTATVTVTDSDGDTDTLDFDWTVNEDLVPSFGTASIADKDWTLRTSITAFTVPAATGGDGTLRYSVSGLLSAVWMSTSTRQVSGRPLGNDASSGTATVTVKDADGDTDTLSFDWSVADPMPDFGTASVSDKTWTQNTAITRFTVPAASGGNSPLRYSATGLPAGVTMSSLRRVSGTPTASGSGTATVTARDADGDTATLEFTWSVAADLMPTFGTSSVSAKSWTQNGAITAFTVPAASGGDGTLSYSASGLPAGVSMDASRSVSGTPSTAGMGTATVTATDADGDTATLDFTWNVAADLMPTFGTSSVSAKSWKENAAITSFTVPAATGGDTPLSYSASGLPSGVSMNASRSVSGTPATAGMGTATVTATDADGDTATLDFTWSVAADLMPTFGTSSVSAKSWKENAAITAFTVPAATGGDTSLSYSASGLPSGVSMNSSRSVSGTPTASGMGTATVTVSDDDGDTATLSFDWSVAADLMPTFGTSSVSAKSWKENAAITAFTVPVATGGDTPLSYSASGLPAGVSMNSSRSVSGTPTASGMGTATVTVSDDDGDTATLSFDWSVAADLMPTFGTSSVSAKSWTQHHAIAVFTVPTASSGDAPLSYGAAGLPAGVSMSTARQVSGTPTATGSGTATVTVTDRDGDTDTKTFNWTVSAPLPGQLKALPNPSTDGNYSVSQTAPPALPADVLTTDLQTTNYYNLVETPPMGDERSYGLGRGPVSQVFTGKSTGTYRYRLQTCVFTVQRTEFDATDTTVCTDVGASLSVTVTPPPVPGAITGPGNSINGTYTLNWGSSTGATRYELQERRNGGRWSSVSRTDSSTTSHAFTGKRNAIYDYRVNACKLSACSAWTAVKAVTVSIPPTAGFDESYIIRAGDLGSDGDTDIYLSPLAIGSGNVGEFIIRNDSGTFVLDNTPSTTNLATAQQWTESTTLYLVIEDINSDGVADAYVKGITGSITNAVDQFVVSAATAGAAPTALIAVDSRFRDFFTAVMAWYQDFDHFDITTSSRTWVIHSATDVEAAYNSLSQECITKWGQCATYDGTLTTYYNGLNACVVALASQGFAATENGRPVSRAQACGFSWRAFFGVVEQGVTITDFTEVPVSAAEFIAIAENEHDVYEIEDLADVLESALGIEIGKIASPTEEQRDFEINNALLSVWNGINRQRSRPSDSYQVYLTKRRPMLFGLENLRNDFWHAALEYSLSRNIFVPTIAAYARSGEGSLPSLILVSERNDPSEIRNLRVGVLTSSTYPTPLALWGALIESDKNYCDDLPYSFSEASEATGYNSNGFINGIITSVNGTVTGANEANPVRRFFLGYRAVPTTEFQQFQPPGC